VFENNNIVSVCEVLDLMSDQKNGFILQKTINAVVEQMSTNVGVHSRKGVVQEVDVSLFVNCPERKEYFFYLNCESSLQF